MITNDGDKDMGYLAILGLVILGAGILASILGIFFAIYAKQNGRMTRELVERMHMETQRLIKEMDEHAEERHKEVIEILSHLRVT